MAAQYDLTSKMIPFLDLHLVFPLLEFLEINEVMNLIGKATEALAHHTFSKHTQHTAQQSTAPASATTMTQGSLRVQPVSTATLLECCMDWQIGRLSIEQTGQPSKERHH